MDERKLVMVVEDVEAARTALQWALRNLLRYGDLLTLLHVFPSSAASKSSRKKKKLRLRGFQLALSFKHICDRHALDPKIEIVVTEGDDDGRRISAVVREIGAATLIAGLHDQSFLYKLAMAHNNITSHLNCRVLAIKQPPPITEKSTTTPPTVLDGSTNMDFSLIEVTRLSVPHDVPQPKIPYRIWPSATAILWRSRGTRRERR